MDVLVTFTTILVALPMCRSESVVEISNYEAGLHPILQRIESLEARLSECTRKTKYLEQSQRRQENEIGLQESKIQKLESRAIMTDENESKLAKLESKLKEALHIINKLVKEVEMTKLQGKLDNTSGNHFQSCEKCEEYMQSQSLGYTSGGSKIDQTSDNGKISGMISRMKRPSGIGKTNVAFSVSVSGWNEITLTNHGLFPFTIVQLNEVNGFDSNVNVFICPVTGIYFFTASIGTSHDRFQASIRINGFEKVRISTGDGSGFKHGTNSVVTHCTIGQTVYVSTIGGAVISTEDLFCMFSGFLIAETEV